MKQAVLTGLSLCALTGAPVLAHHGSAASYHQDRWITVRGVVTELNWRNPHCSLFLDVTQASGEVVSYAIELASPGLMVRRNGWTRDTFEPGDTRLQGAPLAHGRAGRRVPVRLRGPDQRRARADARSPGRGAVTRAPGGRRLTAALTAACVFPLAAFGQGGRDLEGVWARGFGGGRDQPMSQWTAAGLPFTEEGRARFDANKPGKGPRQVMPALGNDPLGDANPPGLYRTLIYNRPFELIQTADKVVQLFEWSRVWRIIWTDGREVPDTVAAGPYWYGYPALYAEPWTSDPIRYAFQEPGSPAGELFEVIYAPIDEEAFNSRIRDPAASGPAP